MVLKSYISKTKPRWRRAKCHLWPHNVSGRVKEDEVVLLLATYCLKRKALDTISYGLREEEKLSHGQYLQWKKVKKKALLQMSTDAWVGLCGRGGTSEQTPFRQTCPAADSVSAGSLHCQLLPGVFTAENCLAWDCALIGQPVQPLNGRVGVGKRAVHLAGCDHPTEQFSFQSPLWVG